MEKERTINELLKLLYKVYYSKEYPYGGLCAVVHTLHLAKRITKDEALLLKDYIYEYKPKNYSFYLPYFWSANNRFLRCQWLRKHLIITEPCA